MKKCPRCNSSRFRKNVITENGKKYYVQSCENCGFINKVEI